MTEVTKEFIQKNEDENIIEIEIERLPSFKNHPFQVKEDNEILSKYWMVKMDMR